MKPPRDPTERPPDFLTAQDVARRLNMSVRTLYRLVKAGVLPKPVRFSRKLLRWRARDIDRLKRDPPRCAQ
jgi:excisionase family DNA binding protein